MNMNPDAHIEVHASLQCPVCKKTIASKRLVAEAVAALGVTDTQAVTALLDAKAEVVAEAERRGWTAEFCGGCRDMTPEERAERAKEVAEDAAQILRARGRRG